MLHSDKYVEVRLPLDVAYGMLGMLLQMLNGNVIAGSCRSTDADLPQLVRMYNQTAGDMLKMLDAADYCEHVKEAARDMRAAEKEGH